MDLQFIEFRRGMRKQVVTSQISLNEEYNLSAPELPHLWRRQLWFLKDRILLLDLYASETATWKQIILNPSFPLTRAGKVETQHFSFETELCDEYILCRFLLGMRQSWKDNFSSSMESGVNLCSVLHPTSFSCKVRSPSFRHLDSVYPGRSLSW